MMEELFTDPYVIIFLVVWIIEFYLFGLQRASLLITRESDLDYSTYGPLLLPDWYPITWIFRIGKYILLVVILFINWRWSIGLFLIQFLASLVIPIPYKFLYSDIFRNKLHKLRMTNMNSSMACEFMLKKAGYSLKKHNS